MKVTSTLLFFGIAAVASATSVTFNFATQTINGTVINGVSENATTTQIQTYMDQVLTAAGCTGCTVAVTGAFADTTWNGDGHVTGPSTGSKSYTLGTSNGPYTAGSTQTSTVNSSYDTFLATTNDGDTQTDSQITMKFSGFTINGAASFDYEIFPNINCTAMTSSGCGGTGEPNQPDFKFDTNGSSQVFRTLGVTPGTTNGNSNNSPDSQTETAPQYIGSWSGSLSNVSELDFVDWPATIGMDNLTVSWNTSTSPVPEPYSVLLFGTVVAAIFLRKKIRKTA
jgi:hypothetical protein